MTNEPTTTEAIEALKSAPPAVQEIFAAEETNDFIDELRKRYQLHVDVAGSLGKEIGFLLLGLVSPQDFFKKLTLAGVDTIKAQGIVNDLNEHIFKPLRTKMQEGGAGTPAPRLLTPTPQPRVDVPPMVRPSVGTASATVKPVFQPAHPTQTPPVPQRVPPPPPPNLPGASVAMPAANPLPRTVPPMPVSRPMVPPPTATPSPTGLSQPPATPPSPKPFSPGVPMLKKYGVDPYREPVE